MAGAKAIIFDLIASDHASKVFEKVGATAEATAAEVEGSQRKIASAHTTSAAAMDKFAKAAKVAFLGASGAVALFGAASVKMAGDFQTQMRLLQTGAGESAANLKMVSDGILKLAGDTGTSVKDLSSAMYLIESSGKHGAAGLAVLKAAAQGAKADGADLNTVADALTTVLNDLGDKAVKAAGGVPTIMSQMVAAVAQGKMRMDDFAGSIHNFLPNAQALGIKFNEAAAAMATMTAEGISADQASQNLNHALLHLASPTLAQTKAMAAYGLSATDVAKNLGRRGLAGTLQLLEDAVAKHMGPAGLTIVNTFNRSKEAAADAAKMYGALPAASKRVADELRNGSVSLKTWTADVKGLPANQANLVKQWAATQNASKGFNQMLKSGSPAAQTFSGAMRALTGDATGLQVALHLGGDHMKDFRDKTKTIAAATKDAKGNVKDWTEVQKGFNQTMSRVKESIDAGMIKVGTALLPAATGAANGALNALPKVWDGLKRGAADALPFLQNAAKAVLPVLEQFGSKLIGIVGPGVQMLWKLIQTDLIPAFKQFWPVIQPVVKLLLELFGGAVLGVIEGAFKVIGGGIKVISGLFNVFAGILHGKWGEAWKGIKQIVSGAFEAVIGAIQVYLNVGVLGIFKKGLLFLTRDLWQGAFDKLASIAITGGDAIGRTIVGWLADLGKLFKGGLDAVGKVFTDAWDTLQLEAMYAWDAIKALAGDFVDGLKTVIVAGFKALLDIWLTIAGGIVDGAAKAFGWIHGIGGQVKKAQQQFHDLANSVNASLNSIISDKQISISVSDQTVATVKSLYGGGGKNATWSNIKVVNGTPQFKADGGLLYGPGGPRDDVIPIMASNGEYIVNAASTSQYLPVLEAINAGRFADGGMVGGLSQTGSSLRTDFRYLNAGLSAAAQHIGSVIASKVQAVMASAGPTVGGSVPGSVNAYRGVVAQALQMLGQSPALIPAVLRRMRLESGGNPSVVNKWDSNWKAGTPSVGLMQVIGPTFRSYAGPFKNIGPFSYGVSTSALANVYAGLNYALHRYGSIGAIDPLVHPGGYANGGLVRHVRTAAGARRYHLPVGSVIPSGSRSSSSAGRSSSSRSGGPMVLSAAQWNSVATALDRIRGGGTSVSAFSNGLASILKKFMTGGALDQALALLRRQDREWLAYTKAHSVIVARVSAAQKQLASTVQARSQYAQQVASNLSSMGDLTGAFSHATTDGATAGQVKGYLSTQLASLSRFGGNLGALRRLGLSPALIGQLADAGVSGGGMTADVLAHSSKADIARINRLESQIGNVSRNIGNATAAAKYDGSISSIKSNLSRLEHQEKRAADSLQHLATDMARSVVHELRSNHVRVHVSV